MNIEKCQFGACEHTVATLNEETHDENICWKITKPELIDEPTNEKYCPCKQDKGFIRRYDRVGYMEVSQHDILVTKSCSRCGIDCLFRIDETTCLACKTKTDYDSE